MNFNIMINGRIQVGIDFEVLQEAIAGLYDDIDSFIVLEPQTPIGGSIYLQAALDGNQYMIETRVMTDNNFIHYRYITTDLNEVVTIFTDYYRKHRLTNLDSWLDATSEF
ncbi:hypothetical protein [Budvicia diplopodorum]|uniref:hypothetical protein n=1 Tax=Budvicia diplopodorum TaxID=1119056 RepID=UPI00135C510C|nr:hypothetical protein [Budvicia diplopodorum]